MEICTQKIHDEELKTGKLTDGHRQLRMTEETVSLVKGEPDITVNLTVSSKDSLCWDCWNSRLMKIDWHEFLKEQVEAGKKKNPGRAAAQD